MPEAFLDIAPLFDERWTGISVVTEQIASAALRDDAIDWRFFYENIAVERGVVLELLQRRAGGAYLGYLGRQLWAGARLRESETSSAAAVFLNVKPPIGTFRREALIVHDFSALLTPEFHHLDTVRHHAYRVRRDVETTDQFFCVSAATAGDLRAYFQIPASRISVIPLGIAVDPCDLADLTARRTQEVEPYVCMLGTIEPRKNGRIIFSYLQLYRRFLDKYKILFVGADGWLDEKNRLLDSIRGSGLDASRIVFSGYVGERTKLELLYFSRFCIYASLFEGFGIPVAEAAHLGKFVVCSNSD